jgi:DNA polymerase-3 subunit gamma/tau
MHTLALARKWRPKLFSELIGQEHVVRALENALTAQRVHHAYLFTGTRGVGKTTLARVLAKALNCESGVTATPCGRCAACQAIDQGRYVDVIELDAASHTQVDNMRELLENALYAPTAGRFKAYIIDEVHMLSRSAFAAMLKTLEEPPAHVKFILATTDPQKVPVTVLSRCLQFNLKQIPPQLVAQQLQRILEAEGVCFESAALALLSRAAQGSMRDALSLLDQAIAHGAGRVEERGVRAMLGAIDADFSFELLQALSDRDGAALIAQADRMAERGLSFDSALQELASLLQRIALAQLAPAALDRAPDRERVVELARKFSAEDVQLFYQIATQGRADLALAPDEYAGFTMALLRMLAFVPGDDSQQPPARISGQSVASASAMGPQFAAAQADWPELVKRLPEGMAKMLAQHCELKERQGNRFVLAVGKMQGHLLTDTYCGRLQAALQELLGEKIRIEFETAANHTNSPAAQNAREREAKLTQAREAIANDPFVGALIEHCDARVITESIKPIRET